MGDKAVPSLIVTIGPNAPVSTISPPAAVRRDSPACAPARLRRSADAPDTRCRGRWRPAPGCGSCMAHCFRSSPAGRCAGPPMTYRPQEALSATVSTKPIDQSRMRLPTTSSAGNTHSMALYSSSKVVSACGRSPASAPGRSRPPPWAAARGQTAPRRCRRSTCRQTGCRSPAD